MQVKSPHCKIAPINKNNEEINLNIKSSYKCMYNNFALYVYVCMFSLKKIMRDQIERDYIIIAFIT